MKSNDGKEQYKSYRVPFAYEMYGHIEVMLKGTDHTDEEIQRAAEDALKKMNYQEMLDASDYLLDSESIDYDGVIIDDGFVPSDQIQEEEAERE